MTAYNSVISDLKNFVQLIECDGQITLGHVAPIRHCVATATDEAQCLAMLVRREGETLDDLLQRPDAAIADAYEKSLTSVRTHDDAHARPGAAQRLDEPT